MNRLWQKDGAILHATVDPIEGEYRAAWWVTLDNLFGMQSEEGHIAIFKGERVAQAWLNQQAKTHGFKPPHELAL